MTSHLDVDTLSRDGFEDYNFLRLTLTHCYLTWYPSTTIYEDQKNSMLNYKGDIVLPDVTKRGLYMVINFVCMSTFEDAADILSDNNLANFIQSSVNISHVNIMKPKNVSQVSYVDYTLGNIQSRKRENVETETLAKFWNIYRKKTLKNVKRTTQRGIRSCLHSSLYRRYQKNDRMMRFNRLPYSVLSDTMKSGVVSKRENKYGQYYCTQYG